MSSEMEDSYQAQARIDRINAFRTELAQLTQEGLAPPETLRGQWAGHHDQLLAHWAAQYEVDTSGSQKQLTLGMRIASLLGALALSAAIYLFFLHFWGGLALPLQVTLLVGLPLVAMLGVEWAARRERTRYFAAIVALVAFAAFVLDLSMLGRIFNVIPSQNAFLAWGAFALLLAYAYELRLLLVAGLLCLLGYLSATVGTWGGGYWLSFGERPENFLLAGALITTIGLLNLRHLPGFAALYRLVGLLTIFIAVLVLSHWGRVSYLPLPKDQVEIGYQLFGFLLAGLTIWYGIRRGWSGLINVGSTFFILYLYTRLVDWWWDGLPRYLFFLLVGFIAILLLLVLRRLHSYQRRATP